jgi:hypothetical protein
LKLSLASRFAVGRDAGFVLYLDQKCAPALLHQLRFGRTFQRLHAALGVDVHADQAVAVEDLLHLRHGRGLCRCGLRQFAQLGRFGGGQRLADNLQSFHQPQHLRGERLVLHVCDYGKFLGGKSYSG